MPDSNPDGRSDFEKFVGPDRRSLPVPKGLAGLVLLIAIVLVAGLFVLYPWDSPDVDGAFFGFVDDAIPARVSSVESETCEFAADLTCTEVGFEFTGESPTGDVGYTQEFTEDQTRASFSVGERVFVGVVEGEDGQISYQYYDRDRRILLGLVGLLFAVAVVALGRMRGLAALGGLVISLLVLFWFVIPAMIAGRDAVAVAVVGGGLIVLVALYLAHGYTPLTHVAAVGAFAALSLTALLSWLAVSAAYFTGFTTEEAFYLTGLEGVEIGGLVLAGIVLGAIGALDDVTVTQASAVWELRGANPGLTSHELYASGLRVGRDHIASTVNTLLLAYAGAALPLIILFSLSGLPLGATLSSEVIAVEIVRTLVGSIGLVAAVPITTWLAARRATR